jgi:gluconolactonase
LGFACSSSEESGNTGGTTSTGTGGAPPATGGAPSATGGAAAAKGGTGGASNANTGGVATGGAPNGSSGGTTNPPTGGTSTGGASGGAATGGASAGGAPSGGSGGSPPGGAPSGGSPSTNLKGGASAAYVCKAGETYGNPLQGMGEIQTISAPTMGKVTYFAFIEGPIWVASQQTLFFSDNVSPERIWKVKPPSTTPELFLENSGSNGLGLDSNDQLLVADQVQRRITRVDPSSASPTATLVVSTGNAKPNDLVMRSNGAIYFTDPQMQPGVYYVSPSGTVSPALMVGQNPNGLALSPDEKTLYIGNVNSREITSFSLADDGAIDASSSKLFATTTGNTLDGMAVDCAGNLYASTQTGVEVLSPAGMPVGTIQTGEASNVTFGGADRKTLYATSRSVLKAVTLAVPGLPD